MQPIHVYLFLFSVASYLLGSVPFGQVIARKVAEVDITQKGSGNIGATNVARVIGLRWGIVTLMLDMLKGFVPAFLFHRLFPHFEIGVCAVGLLALIGHQFSAFGRLRGGKGVATALGIYLATAPIPCLMAVAIFVLVVCISDFVSLGSLISVAALPFFLLLLGQSQTMLVASFITATLIWFKHRENIERLLSGEERRWRSKIMKEGPGAGPIPDRNKNK